MSRKAWLFLAVFFAGIGCAVTGVLLSPHQVPGAPRQDLPPLALGLLIGGAILVIIGGKFGLAPALYSLVESRVIPGWVWLLFFIVLGGAALAYLFFFRGA
jgi:hypothetical protein